LAIGILTTGVCLGEFVAANNSFTNTVKNYDEEVSNKSLSTWVEEHYGIKTRVKTLRQPSELATDAAQMAIKRAGLTINEIDFILLNTTTGDHHQPTTASKVQQLLGMKADSFAIEINMPCAGNIFGLAMAKSMIASGLGKIGLVIGVDKMNTIINQEDFVMATMFGDAAGAAIVSHNPAYAIKEVLLRSKGDVENSLVIPSGGSAIPLSAKTLEEKQQFLKMNGNVTKKFIQSTLKSTIQKLLEQANLDVASVDKVITHQASKPIIENILNDIGFNATQLFFTVEKYGNTSSASILVTLNELIQNEGVVAKNILLAGMGGGLNWGGVFLQKVEI